MRWKLHTLTVEGLSNSDLLRQRWQMSFASRPLSESVADLVYQLDLVNELPAAPEEKPAFEQGNLLAYYIAGNEVTVHFPRFGQLKLDLAAGTTNGQIVTAALDTYGVLEDTIAIGLSPHLRRRGLFLIHAFAAELDGRACLIVGGIGAGKTTTGMSLLDAGWRLLSNDSPIVAAKGQLLSYPGLLAGFPASFARFASTKHLANQEPESTVGRKKLTVPAEQIWPNVWAEEAPAAMIVFPQIEPRENHLLEPLSQPEALRRLLPHAIEQWDRPMMPAHLAVLSQLTTAAPAYILHLSPDVLAIPAVLKATLQKDDTPVS